MVSLDTTFSESFKKSDQKKTSSAMAYEASRFLRKGRSLNLHERELGSVRSCGRYRLVVSSQRESFFLKKAD
jgi:hypothetical protein